MINQDALQEIIESCAEEMSRLNSKNNDSICWHCGREFSRSEGNFVSNHNGDEKFICFECEIEKFLEEFQALKLSDIICDHCGSSHDLVLLNGYGRDGLKVLCPICLAKEIKKN